MIEIIEDVLYKWDENFMYIVNLLFFDNLVKEVGKVESLFGFCVIGKFGDFVIIDYILLVGVIGKDILVGKFF